jgi:hypothetical protein
MLKVLFRKIYLYLIKLEQMKRIKTILSYIFPMPEDFKVRQVIIKPEQHPRTSKIGKTIMPINIPFEAWFNGEWAKHLNGEKPLRGKK